jgi:hypothetical protein
METAIRKEKRCKQTDKMGIPKGYRDKSDPKRFGMLVHLPFDVA